MNIFDVLYPPLKFPKEHKIKMFECWRLMGIEEKYFEKARQVNSNTQLYKQAGNGIVVGVLEAIFRELIEE